jgi:transposase-like protein
MDSKKCSYCGSTKITESYHFFDNVTVYLCLSCGKHFSLDPKELGKITPRPA